MTPGERPADVYHRVHALLGDRFRLDSLVALSRERVLFLAWDQALKRRVSLRVNFPGDPGVRAWFLREAEALAQLDHPAIRHVYELGEIDGAAYRVGFPAGPFAFALEIWDVDVRGTIAAYLEHQRARARRGRR